MSCLLADSEMITKDDEKWRVEDQKRGGDNTDDLIFANTQPSEESGNVATSME